MGRVRRPRAGPGCARPDRGSALTPSYRSSEESEGALVAACVRGDAGAWDRFHARFQPLILRTAERALARRGVPDPADLAQDVAADVIAQLLARERAALARFQGRSALSTWLVVLTRRQAGRALRRRRPETLAEPQALPAGQRSPSDEALLSERAELIRQELDSLRQRDRLALQLFYEGQQSYAEVAAALDVPANRIGTLLARARERLARALGRR